MGTRTASWSEEGEVRARLEAELDRLLRVLDAHSDVEQVWSRYPELAEGCAQLAALDQHYIPTRYPDALPGGTPADVYTLEQARGATQSAREVLQEMRART